MDDSNNSNNSNNLPAPTDPNVATNPQTPIPADSTTQLSATPEPQSSFQAFDPSAVQNQSPAIQGSSGFAGPDVNQAFAPKPWYEATIPTPTQSGPTPAESGPALGTTQPSAEQNPSVDQNQSPAMQENPLSSYGLGTADSIQPTVETVPPEPTPIQSEPTEPAPTDLSQIAEEVNTKPVTSSEIYNPSIADQPNLVVEGEQPAVITSSPPTEGRKIPTVAIIGAGVILVLIVGAASAYFILGIGQTQQSAATQPPLTNPPSAVQNQTTPSAVPSISASSQPVTGSSTPTQSGSTFGQINGVIEPSPVASSSSSSAIDQLRQRQSQ